MEERVKWNAQINRVIENESGCPGDLKNVTEYKDKYPECSEIFKEEGNKKEDGWNKNPEWYKNFLCIVCKKNKSSQPFGHSPCSKSCSDELDFAKNVMSKRQEEYWRETQNLCILCGKDNEERFNNSELCSIKCLVHYRRKWRLDVQGN